MFQIHFLLFCKYMIVDNQKFVEQSKNFGEDKFWVETKCIIIYKDMWQDSSRVSNFFSPGSFSCLFRIK